jgi:hypothetical protein
MFWQDSSQLPQWCASDAQCQAGARDQPTVDLPSGVILLHGDARSSSASRKSHSGSGFTEAIIVQ